MPRYLVERQFQVGQEQMPELGRRSRRLVQEQFPQISWEHSHVAVDEGGGVKMFCLYEAPTEDIVRQHAKELGLHEIQAVYEIAGDVTPADFPL
jgi:ligand-binding SRPBCC domain-containing protein